MAWYRRHRYDVGVGVALGVLTCGVLIQLGVLRQILLLSFVVLVMHEFEEYGWPGGAPVFMNEVMRPSGTPDRYPLNQNNSMVVNVFAGYPFYALPIFFPNIIWLGLAPVLFGFVEVLLHTGAGGVKAKALYNPGLVTVVPWLVLGTWYLHVVYGRGVITATDWWIAVPYLIGFFAVFIGLMGYVLLADRDSKYPFADEEMSRFERYRRFVHAAAPVRHTHPSAGHAH
jgi:Protein of unknown function with HXXEE motif